MDNAEPRRVVKSFSPAAAFSTSWLLLLAQLASHAGGNNIRTLLWWLCTAHLLASFPKSEQICFAPDLMGGK